MNEKEINEYLQGVLAGKRALPTELETMALKKFNEVNQQVTQTQQKVQTSAQQLEALKAQLLRMSGQRDAFAQILISAEEARATTPELKVVPGDESVGMNLNELKESFKADKIEAVDNDGNLLDTTEPEEKGEVKE